MSSHSSATTVASRAGKTGVAALDWLEARGIDPELAIRYGIGYTKTVQGGPALAMSYRLRGVEIARKYRDLREKRFCRDEGGQACFWNVDCLSDHTLADEPILITEGELDAMSAIQAGLLRAVSVPDGARSNLDFIDHLNLWPLLAEAKDVVLCGDADGPGQELNQELARRLGAARCRHLVYPEGCKDLSDILQKQGAKAVVKAVNAAKPYPIKGLYQLSDYPDTEMPQLYETAWQNLSKHLKLWTGEFLVVTGVPGHGKSRWALDLLSHMARTYGHRSVIASFEMRIVPYVRKALREIHTHTDHPSRNVTRDADEFIQRHFLFIDQDPRGGDDDMPLEWMIERAADAVIRHGVKWFLLDPWNQVEHLRVKGESESEYICRAVRSLKRFARSYDCGVIVVAHPTKGVQQADGVVRLPKLYDISGAAHWANAADHGVVVHRPNGGSFSEVHVQKSRYYEAGVPGLGVLMMQAGRLVDAPKASIDDEVSDV